jgi:hypothetical protein
MEASEQIFAAVKVTEPPQHFTEKVASGYVQNWDWYYEWMTNRAAAVLQDVQELVNSYRFDDSDGRIDYFNTNFYADFNIGKWDKPFKIVPKRERIQTNKGPEKAKRITA